MTKAKKAREVRTGDIVRMRGGFMRVSETMRDRQGRVIFRSDSFGKPAYSRATKPEANVRCL
jgi:hypothetical protein